MEKFFKRIMRRMPENWQQELKRYHFRRQINTDGFISDEEEYNLLNNFVEFGDWVLDIGANVGHYTKKLSSIVGVDGRVIAFEPVPLTFELLAANVALFPIQNVTLINVAVSDCTDIQGMDMPKFNTGLTNYYRAHIVKENAKLRVLSMPIDNLNIIKDIKLVKIDAEGHELPILRGMKKLLERDKPILIVEDTDKEIGSYLSRFSYESNKIEGSCNIIFKPQSLK